MDEAMFFLFRDRSNYVALLFNKISRNCTYVEQLNKIIIIIIIIKYQIYIALISNKCSEALNSTT